MHTYLLELPIELILLDALRMNHTDTMMNHTDGWMSSWTGGGMWIWAVIGVAVVVLLVVVIIKLSKK
jgi:anti-sigma-K factor RskA